MRYPPGTRTTQGDSTPNSSVSPTRPGSTATPTCSHFEPTGCTASMIRPVVPSCPEYHMRSVPSRSSRTQGLLARALSGSPGDPGEKISPSCVHSTVGPLACLRGDHGLPVSVRFAGGPDKILFGSPLGIGSTCVTNHRNVVPGWIPALGKVGRPARSLLIELPQLPGEMVDRHVDAAPGIARRGLGSENWSTGQDRALDDVAVIVLVVALPVHLDIN